MNIHGSDYLLGNHIFAADIPQRVDPHGVFDTITASNFFMRYKIYLK